MGRKITIASATLNQWALDFEGNRDRILQSILEAKEMGATFRTGPELEITGYSCEDHFYESDTFLHSWEVLLDLLTSPLCKDIIVDIGMPVMHKNVSYNCRVIFLNRKILLIRPKLMTCDGGNYRESRWFSCWKQVRQVEDYYLPIMISKVINQEVVPFGDAVIATKDTCIGFEICEELWNPMSSHIGMALDGVEIICNSSGGYTQLRKSHFTADLVKSATLKAKGCYVFSNLRGCDGQRVYFNGRSCIALNGEIVSRSKEFSLEDVEVIVATIDLEDIRTQRNIVRSMAHMSSGSSSYIRVQADFTLCPPNDMTLSCSRPLEWPQLKPEEEIEQGPACWLWDYLRRSGQFGFFLPLSGGVDSSSAALIVYSMCKMVTEYVQMGDTKVLNDVREICGSPEYVPKSANELCNRILFTCYMGTENSSKETKERAASLSDSIGSNHMHITIDKAVTACLEIFSSVVGFFPRSKSEGGYAHFALQNMQGRLRMVFSYLFAQLNLWTRSRPGGLLVLGSGNVDDSLRGSMTKYDCSSADVNPIGGISKTDLRKFLHYCREKFKIPILDDILEAVPTAEDTSMTYAELSEYGRLRKMQHCGPYSMYCKLVQTWSESHPAVVAEKVKHFFRCYAMNRHKMTVITPAFHAESYSPDDNRFDLRPFLYRANWSWQFRAIDKEQENVERSREKH